MLIKKQPLHIMVANILRQEIRSKKPDEQIESEKKLADRFGVSSLTVREALARLAEEGLIERRHGSGTFVKEKKNAVALLVADWLFKGSGTFFFMQLAQMLRENFMRSSCEVGFHLGKFEPWTGQGVNPRWPLVSEIEKGELSGVIAICVEPPRAWVDFALECGVACVTSSQGLPYSVGSDSRFMVKEGVRFICEKGRKNIAFFQWSNISAEEEQAGLFLRPFRDALAEYNLPYRREWVFGSLKPDDPTSSWQSFMALWRANGLRPDSILVVDDLLYRDVAIALLCAGVRVPQDVLVVTHANRGSDIIYPFSTVRMEYDPQDFANALSDICLRLMNGEKVSKEPVVIPFRWVGVEGIT